MLTCHSCIKRCLQTIIGQQGLFTSPNLCSTTTAARISRRAFASDPYSEHGQRRSSSPQQNDKVWAISSPPNQLPQSRFEKNRQQWLASRGTRPPSKPSSRKPNLNTESAMRKHFQYLQDPLKLSEYIRRTLRNDDFETAEKVVQYASKTLQCVVSWNHLVDWQLSRGKMNDAIKTFNEMKKRAQVPDAHTYTIIFRGCAEHKDAPQALEKVLAIYHSMFTDKCPVKPNTIHVNAVLKMCAKAQNMDAMFAIADHLPEKGLRSPNNLTYTTILNGLRNKLMFGMHGDMTSVQQRQDAQNSILTARHIWSDIVKRWRKGDIWIDEELVCSMGRLLLMGNDRDADDVLSLIEQSMSIPRQTTRAFASPPPVQAPESLPQKEDHSEMTSKHPAHSSISTNFPDQTQDSPPTTDKISGDSSDPAEEPEAALIPFTESIIPVTPPKGISAFPIPAQNTLSLIMAALLKLRDREAPKKYWSFLTTNGLEPDAENYNAYLRTLRITRSSSETVNILLSMPKTYITTGTYRIAIATCIRDKNNPNAFSNAGKILDLMQSTHSKPDPKVLDTYLEAAITAPVHIQPTASPSQEVTLMKFAHGAQISRALHRLNPSIVNLRAVLAFGDESMKQVSGAERDKYISAILQLTQRMVSAYDVLMDKGMVPRSDYVPLTQERSKLAAFITRHKHLRRDMEAGISKKRVEAMKSEERRPGFRSVHPKAEKDVEVV